MREGVPVHAAELPPQSVAVGTALAEALEVGVGDHLETPRGDRVVIEVRQGGHEAWAADGDGSAWTLSGSSRAADRLRAHRSSAVLPDGVGYHPVHHTPVHGEPLPDRALAWIRGRGAQAVLDDVAWRQDHADLARIAAEAIERGERPAAAWRYRARHPEVGLGPIREGLEAMAFALGLDLRADAGGVRVGLQRRRPVEDWSSGEPTTSAAFRHGKPAPGGLHDPALFGTRGQPRFAHIALPWRMLPAHLAPWAAELLDRPQVDLMDEAQRNGVDGLVPELDRALERRMPRPCSLDGQPLRATDFLWSEVALVPATCRRPVRQDGQRMVHGLDGTLHTLVAAVRRRMKLGEIRADLDVDLRARVQRALDAYLSIGPGSEADEGWGWSVAEDLQAALQVDGVMLDWGGRAVAVVEDRDEVALPRALAEGFPGEVDSVLLVHMPSGVTASRLKWTDGALVRLPPDVASSLGARTGDLVRVIPPLSSEAALEVDALADGVRLSTLPEEPGWLDEVAVAGPDRAASVLVFAAMHGAADRGLGPVGRRVYGGLLPPARGSDEAEVDAVHRGFHLLLRLSEGPGRTLPPGVAAEKLDRVEQQLGRALVPEVRALWAVHDGQMGDAAPLLIVDGDRWRLLSLDPGAVRDGRVPLAVGEGRELLEVDADGQVWRGRSLVARSLGRMLQVSYLAQRG